MAYVPKIFVDRSTEFPSRRTLTAVSGQADTFDVARAEGTIFAVGDLPDAANLNAEFGKIKTETDAINTSLNAPTVGQFIYDYQNGKAGYNTSLARGADTFHPFKSDLVIKKIGASAAYTSSSSVGEMHVDCADFSKLKIGSMTTSGSLNYLTWIVTGYVGSTPTTLYNSTAAIANSEYNIASFDKIIFTVYTKGANTTTSGGVYFENVVFSV